MRRSNKLSSAPQPLSRKGLLARFPTEVSVILLYEREALHGSDRIDIFPFEPNSRKVLGVVNGSCHSIQPDGRFGLAAIPNWGRGELLF